MIAKRYLIAAVLLSFFAAPTVASAATEQIAVSAGPDGALIGKLDSDGVVWAKIGLNSDWVKEAGPGAKQFSLSDGPHGITIAVVTASNEITAKSGLYGGWQYISPTGTNVTKVAVADGPDGPLFGMLDSGGAFNVKVGFGGTWYLMAEPATRDIAVADGPHGPMLGTINQGGTSYVKQGSIWASWKPQLDYSVIPGGLSLADGGEGALLGGLDVSGNFKAKFGLTTPWALMAAPGTREMAVSYGPDGALLGFIGDFFYVKQGGLYRSWVRQTDTRPKAIALSDGPNGALLAYIDPSGHLQAKYGPLSNTFTDQGIVSDSTPPVLEASGPFIDALGESYGEDDEYDLWLDSTDEADARAPSGAATIEVKVDGTRVAYADDACNDGQCAELDLTWEFKPDSFTVGPHTVTATAKDYSGNTRTLTWDISVVRTGPSVEEEDVRPTPPVLQGDSATPSQARCARTPDPTSEAEVIVNGRWTGGTESTEYFSDAAYRISRCDFGGNFVREQTVHNITVPGGDVVPLPVETTVPIENGEFLSTAMLYHDPSSPFFAEAWARDGAALRASVLPPTAIGGTRPATTTTAASQSSVCSRPSNYRTYSGAPRWANGGYHYTINLANLPGGNARARGRALAAMVDGHRTWNLTLDHCKNKKTYDFNATFDGSSDDSIGNHHDGKNTEAFSTGQVVSECNGDVVGCTRTRFTSDRILESDTALDSRDQWFSRKKIGRCSGSRYDVWEVSAHEAGHALGLDDVTTPAAVMYQSASYCSDSKRILFQGDVRGIRFLY